MKYALIAIIAFLFAGCSGDFNLGSSDDDQHYQNENGEWIGGDKNPGIYDEPDTNVTEEAVSP